MTISPDNLFGTSVGTIAIVVALVLAAINLVAFLAFGIDKILAENGERRIAETTLLQLALFGGIGGAYAGRALFNHKTRKQPFSNQLHTIAVLQMVGAVFLTILMWCGGACHLV